jgi:hypothetical protein
LHRRGTDIAHLITMPRKQRFKPSRKPKPAPETDAVQQRSNEPPTNGREHEVERAARDRPGSAIESESAKARDKEVERVPPWNESLEKSEDVEPYAPMNRRWEVHPDDVER